MPTPPPMRAGQNAREMAARTPNARTGVNDADDLDQTFVPPIIAPGVPSRLYFLFCRPIKLTPEMYNDRDACNRVGAAQGPRACPKGPLA